MLLLFFSLFSSILSLAGMQAQIYFSYSVTLWDFSCFVFIKTISCSSKDIILPAHHRKFCFLSALMKSGIMGCWNTREKNTL
jgi:hypothetical protein